MSSYIDVVHPDRHAPYLDIPNDVIEYLHYLDFVKLRSPRTVNGYYLDLRGFFRYMMLQWDRADDATPPEKIDLTGISTRDIAGITKRDIFGYLDYARNADNGPKARARKLSALKGFFHYMCTQVNKLPVNPTENISLGTPQKALPKYLTENEAVELLKNIQSDFYERDYCIITLFLNCGMRLAELVTIDLSDFRDDTIRIVGKGNKERLVYLNDACLFSLQRYKKARAALPNLADKDALFVSKRTGKRLSARRVEQIVARCLQSAGLSGRGFSPHKLRHTAATLMYQGGVDMLALKEILGHENVSTTQIYTHINRDQLRQAVASSPLADKTLAVTKVRKVPTALKTADSTSAAPNRAASRRSVPGVSRVARPHIILNSSPARRADQPASHRHKNSAAVSVPIVANRYCTSPAAPFTAATEAAQ